MLLIDKKTNTGIVVGDGLVNINGTITEFDQDNKPDYLGFHLQEDFESWYNLQTQKISFDNIQDVSIATDGIFMFSPVRKQGIADAVDPIRFLLTDTENAVSEEMLNLKLKTLEHQFGLKPTDDIAIVRVIA